jgi:hypothetical protein
MLNYFSISVIIGSVGCCSAQPGSASVAVEPLLKSIR